MSEVREFIESPWEQGIHEAVPYKVVSTLPWGDGSPDPGSVVVKVFDQTALEADVSTETLTGAPTIINDAILLPVLHGLVEKHAYRMEVQWTSGGATFEAYGIIHTKR